ncbi:MAG: alpha/beta fold hydrolase [Candidatus Wildermuthbacteria bacterium]|nr:alpha/beta fold hydrolase [Candidatus Wildermuthbacteria bacterium]
MYLQLITAFHTDCFHGQGRSHMVDVEKYAARKPEWIVSGNTRLAATVDRRDPKHWIIGVHGGHSQRKRKGARWAHLCDLAERLGWSFVAFDQLDEDGDSEPHLDPKINDSLTDLHTVIAELVPKDGRVVLCGHSRGGFLSFAWTTICPEKVAACVLVAPALGNYARFLNRIAEVGVNEASFRERGEVTYLRQGKPQTRTWADLEEERRWDEKERSLAGSFRVPTLVIHSLRDTVIPHGFSKGFGYHCTRADVRIVHIGDHQFNGYEPWLAAETEEFLRSKGIV